MKHPVLFVGTKVSCNTFCAQVRPENLKRPWVNHVQSWYTSADGVHGCGKISCPLSTYCFGSIGRAWHDVWRYTFRYLGFICNTYNSRSVLVYHIIRALQTSPITCNIRRGAFPCIYRVFQTVGKKLWISISKKIIFLPTLRYHTTTFEYVPQGAPRASSAARGARSQGMSAKCAWRSGQAGANWRPAAAVSSMLQDINPDAA